MSGEGVRAGAGCVRVSVLRVCVCENERDKEKEKEKFGKTVNHLLLNNSVSAQKKNH